ncbi:MULTISPECIES: DUF692 domain-containing protein [unclassified Neptuniibacter]|jgi:uncharacterized protein (UPF0276 family)|uniref:HvfB family MNIO-type RiPP peptide maturase n=1 Tax=unclassified Neptuniibacter TaxID=2630693 RepID=UPI0026E38569|nr:MULTISPECIES: DUF692 domain-containing protein [unclassified Neptuniibacter]MDO6512970.1 DUF692 domain-containing protein [Neptuniibacter sp. 2_MG-2023]MDO6592835.1 DUF692 domain-containing protein [Neptuniibacter sp. 1_MG-2023]
MGRVNYPVQGAGFGFRRCMSETLKEVEPSAFDFLEIAPENWMGLGGRFGKAFRQYTEQHAFMAHGLSLSIGGPTPLDMDFLSNLKQFLKDHNIRGYSEHLSYCSDDGHLYDLMPIPFTEEAVKYVAGRIRQVQDVLEQKIAMENVSYYAAPGSEMTEQAFLLAVLEEADCDLLLDVNNIYVNSINHGYDAVDFLKAMPSERIMYVHIAGHYTEAEDLLVDTHGAPVIDPVWSLLQLAYEQFGVLPTLLERDFNIPELPELLQEVEQVRFYQHQWKMSHAQILA